MPVKVLKNVYKLLKCVAVCRCDKRLDYFLGIVEVFYKRLNSCRYCFLILFDKRLNVLNSYLKEFNCCLKVFKRCLESFKCSLDVLYCISEICECVLKSCKRILEMCHKVSESHIGVCEDSLKICKEVLEIFRYCSALSLNKILEVYDNLGYFDDYCLKLCYYFLNYFDSCLDLRDRSLYSLYRFLNFCLDLCKLFKKSVKLCLDLFDSRLKLFDLCLYSFDLCLDLFDLCLDRLLKRFAMIKQDVRILE